MYSYHTYSVCMYFCNDEVINDISFLLSTENLIDCIPVLKSQEAAAGLAYFRSQLLKSESRKECSMILQNMYFTLLSKAAEQMEPEQRTPLLVEAEERVQILLGSQPPRKFSHRTFAPIIALCGKCGRLDLARQYFQAMLDSGLEASSYSYTALMTAAFYDSKESGLQIFEEMVVVYL